MPFFSHDLVRKPVPIPDQVRDKLFGIMRPPRVGGFDATGKMLDCVPDIAAA
jgi:hypothetical protein